MTRFLSLRRLYDRFRLGSAVRRIGNPSYGLGRRRGFYKPCVEALEGRIAPATINWIGGSGDFNDSSHWSDSSHPSGGVLPGPNDDAVINVTGITVTYSSGTDTVKSLTCHDAFLLSGGALFVGTLQEIDKSFTNTARVDVSGSVTLSNATVYLGTTDGTASGQLFFDSTSAQILDGADSADPGTIIFGSSAGNAIWAQYGGSLTLGSNLTVKGADGQIYSDSGSIDMKAALIVDPTLSGQTSGSMMVEGTNWRNDAVLTAKNGGSLTLAGRTHWVNNGTITVQDGGNLTLKGDTSGAGHAWDNTGTISISGGGTMTLDSSGTAADNLGWSNTGTITAAGATTTVNLGGTFSRAALGSFTRQGGPSDDIVNLTGIFNNAGLTQTFDSTTGSWTMNQGTINHGTINGGTIKATTGYGLIAARGDLIGVTLDGTGGNPSPLDMQTDSSSVSVLGALTLKSATINLGKGDGSTGARLYFQDSSPQILDGADGADPGTIIFGSNGENSIIHNGTASVTFGKNLSLQGADVAFDGEGGSKDTMNFEATLTVDPTLFGKSTGTTVISGWSNWTNNGTMTAQNGGGIVLSDPQTFSNLSGGTLTGGTWQAINGGTLKFGAAITTLAANVLVDGAGSLVLGTTYPANTNALAGLTNIAAGGNLTIQNGFILTTTGDLNNSGSLTVGPSSTLAVSGNYTQTSGAGLNIQVGGHSSAGQFGVLNITKTPNLAGGLNMGLVNGFVPSSTDSYQIMSFAQNSRSTDFESKNGLTFPGGQFVPAYGAGNLILTVTSSVVDHFVVSAPAGAAAGTAFNLTVTAVNASGNRIPSYTGTVHFKSSDAKAGLPADYTFTAADGGVHSFSVTFGIKGNQSITTTDTATASITGSATIKVTEAASFAPQVTYGTGRNPYNVAVGDFNRDGIPDLVTANYDSNTISVLLGKGDGTFQPAVDYAAGANPVAVAVGDFRGDGQLDLAVSNWGAGTVSILLGKGNGTFVPGSTFKAGTNPGSLAVGDFTNDGKLDLAVPNWSDGTVSVLLGNGDGTFQPAVNYTVGAEARAVVVGDFNRDGKLDLAVAKQVSGTVGVLLGNGDGTFQPVVNYTVGYRATGIAAADLSHDGKLDLVTANFGTNSVSVLRGNGDGTYQPAGNYAAGANPHSAAVGDFNGDGNLDLAVADNADNNVKVFLGNGDGTFQTPQTYAVGNGPYSLAAADFDRDGKLDLAVADGKDNTVSILLQQATTDTLGVTGLPSPITAGNAGTVSVTIKDAQGNPDMGYVGTVHFTSSDPHAGLPADYTFTAADKGVHSFSVNLQTAGSQSVTVTDTGIAPLTGRQSAILVTPAAASVLGLNSATSSVTAGAPYSFTVTAFDPYGNTATGYLGTVHFTSSDGQAVPPPDYTFTDADKGVHSFNVTFNTAGSQSVTATDTVTASITGTQSGIQVTQATGGRFRLDSATSSATAGVPYSFTVTALDPNGNTASGYAGTVHFTSSDGQAVPPADYTFTTADMGMHSFSVTFKTAGNQTVTGTDIAQGTVHGTSGIVLVSSAAASVLRLEGLVSTTGADAPQAFTLKALDPYGNVAAGYTGTVHFASSDSQAGQPGDYTFTSADGGKHSFSVTFETTGTQTLTVTDTASPALKAIAQVTVTQIVADHLGITAPADATLGQAFGVAVTALDGAGNPVPGYTGTVHFTSSGGQAGLPADYNFVTGDHGSHTFQVTLQAQGDQTVTVADTAASALHGSATVNVSAPLTGGMTAVLVKVLQTLDGLGDQVLAMPALGVKLPVIDKSLNDLLAQVPGAGVGSFLKWSAIAQSYFQGTATPTVAGLVQA
ncbi:MAG TPA: FG-GAP-like repeat-containing protein, partial [Gemmataceae bacterium]|nr:FG-GAP-like repeat-containing protein [Gemmataceae bacterium]